MSYLSKLVRGVPRDQCGSDGRQHASDRYVVVNNRLCFYCGACVAVCPSETLFLHNGFLAIDSAQCSGCERCLKACPVHALTLVGKT